MKLNKENLIQVLSGISHPEKGKNIVELEMVSNLSIEGKKVSFDLLFEKSTDPFIASIKKACVTEAEKAFGEDDIEIRQNITPKVSQAKEQKQSEERSGVDEVKNMVAIASGKGGVGKSTVAVNTAIALAMNGYKVGLVDADVYGPSIPKMFGVEGEKPLGKQEDGKEWILPIEKYGVKLLSIGFFVDPDSALVWRGPMATNALKQLINNADWGELDYLIFDLPPGTSDIHLTLVQTVAVTGAVIVSTPQDLALADAIKGISMFKTKGIDVPVLGLIENMAWFTPEEYPDNKYYIFGKGGCEKLAKEKNIPLLGQIPIVQSIREGGDTGKPAATNLSSVTGKAFEQTATEFIKQIDIRNKKMDPTKRVEIKNK